MRTCRSPSIFSKMSVKPRLKKDEEKSEAQYSWSSWKKVGQNLHWVGGSSEKIKSPMNLNQFPEGSGYKMVGQHAPITFPLWYSSVMPLTAIQLLSLVQVYMLITVIHCSLIVLSIPEMKKGRIEMLSNFSEVGLANLHRFDIGVGGA